MNRRYLNLGGRKFKLPIFLPDATRGVVRSLDSTDLKNTGVLGVVVNTYHLLSEPGLDVLKKAGGVKKLMNFDGLVVSDSGGFQILSLIYEDKRLGEITDEGVVFNLTSTGERKKTLLTPEGSIRAQFALGADILICLDDCPPKDADTAVLKQSVEMTIAWARRCKDEFTKQQKKEKLDGKPLLFAVIQGGRDKKLRQFCAEELKKIGFDGYGFGGWPIGENGRVDYETLEFTAELMPDDLPKYALGIGDPASIARCFKMGYAIFDCVLPTRDARHERLYILKDNLANEVDPAEYLYINREALANDLAPISKTCDCWTCRNFSQAYLRHLFKIKDTLAWRLATIHNLRTYTRLMELLYHA